MQRGFRYVEAVNAGPQGGAGQDGLGSVERWAAQRMVETGHKHCCQDHSLQKEPHPSGSWEFCRLAEESCGEKHLSAPGPRLRRRCGSSHL